MTNKLEDLVLKRFKVHKVEGKIVVREHYHGNYKAMSADDLHSYLTTGEKAENMFVRLSKGSRGIKPGKWYPLE